MTYIYTVKQLYAGVGCELVETYIYTHTSESLRNVTVCVCPADPR